MSNTPQWKVYRGKEYIGCCKYAEDAAALVSLTETGTVKHDHGLVVWREGQEEFSASENRSFASDVMEQRRYNHDLEQYERVYGKMLEETR